MVHPRNPCTCTAVSSRPAWVTVHSTVTEHSKFMATLQKRPCLKNKKNFFTGVIRPSRGLKSMKVLTESVNNNFRFTRDKDTQWNSEKGTKLHYTTTGRPREPAHSEVWAVELVWEVTFIPFTRQGRWVFCEWAELYKYGNKWATPKLVLPLVQFCLPKSKEHWRLLIYLEFNTV